ncbi:MAG: TonB family protein [Candidatus Omnitrophota bacterium]
MLSDRIFLTALAISIFIHGVIIFHAPGFNPFCFNLKKKAEENTEIRYLKKEPEINDIRQKTPRKADLPLKIPSRFSASRVAPPPFINIDKETLARKDRKILSRQPEFNKPVLTKPDVIAVKKRITMPAVDIDKINNPSYLSYYQIIREKVRRAAYQNYTHNDTGEVYLSFVVSRNGFLSDMRLVEEKSSASSYLREIALRSIREASPFPAFPKDLDYPRLSFNVIISFEVE